MRAGAKRIVHREKSKMWFALTRSYKYTENKGELHAWFWMVYAIYDVPPKTLIFVNQTNYLGWHHTRSSLNFQTLPVIQLLVRCYLLIFGVYGDSRPED